MDIKKIGVYIESAFYIFAGTNHFIDPEFYYPLIPEYFTFPEFINSLSGVAEILLGVGLLFYTTRKVSSYAIITMLLAFIPSHIYFINLGSCIEGGLCVPEWVGWGRLLVIHPLLIWWAWRCRK
ncbi:MAG: hypothetical protein AB8B73_15940 [Ekhidna sp.]